MSEEKQKLEITGLIISPEREKVLREVLLKAEELVDAWDDPEWGAAGAESFLDHMDEHVTALEEAIENAIKVSKKDVQ